jgi:hypothetical protein
MAPEKPIIFWVAPSGAIEDTVSTLMDGQRSKFLTGMSIFTVRDRSGGKNWCASHIKDDVNDYKPAACLG